MGSMPHTGPSKGTILAMEPTCQALIDAVRAAIADQKPLRFRGGGSKDFYGHQLKGELLDTRVHSGIVSYEPSELVVTAR